MVRRIFPILLCVAALAATLNFAPNLRAQDYSFGTGNTFKQPSYSPYAGRNFPTNLLWGDTHLHTNLSLDARAGGVILSADDA